MLQQGIDYFPKWNAFLRSPLSQVALDLGIEVDRHSHLRIRFVELATLAF